MEYRRSLIIVNGFLHDFAAGIWLATIVVIVWLHRAHQSDSATILVLNVLERRMFWVSVFSAVLIIATGAGRTFTYIDNWYGEDAESDRRKALLVKHIFLFAAYGAGYLWIWDKVFH